MAECECLSGCIFFNDKMENMPSMANIMKDNFCRGNFNNCARYVVFKALGKGNVPPYLFPNNIEKAKQLISEKK